MIFLTAVNFIVMKPDSVTTTVFVEDQSSSSSSFLLQGAIHFAEQGYSVCVISRDEVKSLPSPIHGVVTPEADVFSLIRFLYLPKWQDLLQHLYSIHYHAQVPSVIVLESVEKYFMPRINSSASKVDKVDVDVQHAALVCASLIDAAAVCAKRLNKPVYLILSIRQSALLETSLKAILDIFFTDYKWFIKIKQSDNESTDRVILSSDNGQTVLKFSQEKDMALYLREVLTSTL